MSPAASTASERVPPHSEEAERGVLGAILLDAERVLDLCESCGLTPEDFFVPAHRELFATFQTMARGQQPVESLSVKNALRESGRLDVLGGVAFLEHLVDQASTSEHAEYYLGIVREKALLRSVIDRSRQAVEACYRGEASAEEILGQVEQEMLSIRGGGSKPTRTWPELVKSGFTQIEHLIQNPSELTGISTGYKGLDQLMLGFQTSEVCILAARPSMGKTSLAMNIAEHVSTGFNIDSNYGATDRPAYPVAIFSLEMSVEALVRRMICSRARVSWGRVVRGFPDSNRDFSRLVKAVDELTRAQIFIDDTAGLSVMELRARARRLRKLHDVKLIVIDYLQMLHYPEKAREGRQQEVAAISSQLKGMAKELGVPVLVLSQLSRAPETRDKKGIPKLSDLRDSGSIEQDADVVLLLRRPIKNKDDPLNNAQDPRLAIVDVAKHRNGATGEVEMNFEDEHTRFFDRAPAAAMEEYPIQASEGGAE